MENNQVKQTDNLKINVTRIQSSLLKSNKDLVRIKKDKVKLQTTQQEKKKISKKEASVESESSFKQSVANIGKRLISGPLSILDKFKEFFGIILLGILVNNLPTIVAKLQKVLGDVKDFLDKNPWIMDTVKWFGSVFAQSIMGLAKIIKVVRPYIGGSFKGALDTLKSTKNKIGTLISTFDELDLSFGGLIKDLGVDKIPDVDKDPTRYSEFAAGGGKKALEEKGQTVDEVVAQGKKNIGGYNSGSRQQSQQPQPQIQLMAPGSMYSAPQKLAKGGTVGNIPPTEGTGRGGPSDIAKGSGSKYATPFARPGGSGRLRRARNSLNAFKIFQQNIEYQKYDQKAQIKNQGMFGEMLKKFKELQKLRAKERPDRSGEPLRPTGGAGGGDFTGSAADIPPEGKALLDAIAGAEAPGYNFRYPSKPFSGYSDHPRIDEPTPDGRTSDAAGRYQFLSTTWDKYKPGKEFTPENQDIAAWRLAIGVYGYGESGLVKALQKDPMKVADKLKDQWPSLPGGSQQNNLTSGFLSRYNAAVKRYRELTTKPTPGAFRNVLPQGNPQLSSGFRTTDRPGHMGIDIGVDANAPVVALQSGKVADFYKSFGGHGDAVVVQHSDGTKLVYGHVVPSSGLQVGDPIEKGRVIAKVLYWDKDGDNTHLHLERIVNGRNVSPIPFLNSVESSRQEELKRNDPRRKLKPRQQGPVLPTPTTQSIMAPTPSVPFGKVYTFTARDGKKYYVKFGKFLEYPLGIIPVDTSKTQNKWLIDDYNTSVERYQSQQGNETSSNLQNKDPIASLLNNNIKPSTPRDPNSFVANAAQLAERESQQTNTVFLYQREYVTT